MDKTRYTDQKFTESFYLNTEGKRVSCRAMHEAVFKAGWDRQELMQQHRGRGPEVLSLDWTLAHHDRSREIYATKRAYDYVDRRMSCYQTVMAAVVA
ncbi:MAG: hypothetical protein AB4040_20690 [Synechococcus sp.]